MLALFHKGTVQYRKHQLIINKSSTNRLSGSPKSISPSFSVGGWAGFTATAHYQNSHEANPSAKTRPRNEEIREKNQQHIKSYASYAKQQNSLDLVGTQDHWQVMIHENKHESGFKI